MKKYLCASVKEIVFFVKGHLISIVLAFEINQSGLRPSHCHFGWTKKPHLVTFNWYSCFLKTFLSLTLPYLLGSEKTFLGWLLFFVSNNEVGYIFLFCFTSFPKLKAVKRWFFSKIQGPHLNSCDGYEQCIRFPTKALFLECD